MSLPTLPTPPYVLVVEDDAMLRDFVLAPSLKKFGFRVDGIGAARDLSDALQRQLPDIVILDVGLPDEDGFTLMRKLRAAVADVGVVMLTARDTPRDRIHGLHQGADAYLTKPLDVELLAATLYSLARRLKSSFETWRLEASDWCLVSPDGGTVALTEHERQLLRLLFRSAGALVSRNDIIADFQVYEPEFDSQRLDQLIHRFRRKVKRLVNVDLPVSSVHGRGYVLSLRGS